MCLEGKVALEGRYVLRMSFWWRRLGEIPEGKLTEHYQIAYHLTLSYFCQNSWRLKLYLMLRPLWMSSLGQKLVDSDFETGCFSDMQLVQGKRRFYVSLFKSTASTIAIQHLPHADLPEE